MRLRLACFMLALALGGCSYIPFYDTATAAISVEGANSADEALKNAEWTLCNAATIGSVNRRYGGSKVLSNAYRTLCSTHGAVPLGRP